MEIKLTSRRWFKTTFTVVSSLILLVGIAYGYWFGYPAYQVSTSINAIHESGEPIFADEIDRIYPPPETEKDCTSLVQQAIDLIKSRSDLTKRRGPFQMTPFVGFRPLQDENNKTIDPFPPTQWTQMAESQKYLEINKDVFDLLDRIREKGSQFRHIGKFEYDTNGQNLSESKAGAFCDTQEIRLIFKLIALRILVLCHQNDEAAVFSDLTRMYELLLAMSPSPGILSSSELVGTQSMIHLVALKCLECLQFEDDQLKQLQQLSESLSFTNRFERSIQFERMDSLGVIEQLRNDPYRQSWDMERSIDRLQLLALNYCNQILKIDQKQTAGHTVMYIKQLTEDQKEEDQSTHLIDTYLSDNNTNTKHCLFYSSYFTFDMFIRSMNRGECKKHAMTICLACYRYKLRHQVFPKDILELSAQFPELDIVDPVGGNAMILKPDEKGIIVYSVGYNLVDNQGDLELRIPPEYETFGYQDIGYRLPNE